MRPFNLLSSQILKGALCKLSQSASFDRRAIAQGDQQAQISKLLFIIIQTPHLISNFHARWPPRTGSSESQLHRAAPLFYSSQTRRRRSNDHHFPPQVIYLVILWSFVWYIFFYFLEINRLLNLSVHSLFSSFLSLFFSLLFFQIDSLRYALQNCRSPLLTNTLSSH